MAREKRVMQNAITEGVIWKQLLLFFFPDCARHIFPAAL